MQKYRIHNPKLITMAKMLRKNMTRQERHLWYDFLRDYPVRILRQKIIGAFIVDFYCAKAKLVIEVDGSQHFTEKGQQDDFERGLKMLNLGIATIRYTNLEIDTQFESVCCDIDASIQARIFPSEN